MAIDGLLLHNYVTDIKALVPFKINRVLMLGENEVTLECYNQKRFFITISTDAQTNRIHLSQAINDQMKIQSSFLLSLKKVATRAVVHAVEQVGLDRIVSFTCSNTDEYGEIFDWKMMVELMGKYANIILCNDQSKIIDALHKIPPYLNNKRTIVATATYQLPPSLNKENPFTATHVSCEDDLLARFEGFSPLLAKEFHHRMRQGETFENILKQCITSKKLYISSQNPTSFAAIALTHLDHPMIESELHQGLELVYQQMDLKKRVKSFTKDIEKVISREIKRLNSKLPKLQEAFLAANDVAKYKEYGDYCFVYAHLIEKGQTQITVPTFDQSSDITIPLDAKLDGKGNAKLFFKKYNKGMAGIPHIQQQIAITQDQLDYFQTLLDQLSFNDIADAIEIKEELSSRGFFKNKQPSKRANKPKKPAYLTIALNKDATLYVGKNNIQNETITFKLAQKQDWWFHVKNATGAHVLLKSNHLDEALIRAAANFAAYYSKLRYSSSVEVQYTQIKNIKKIPKAQPGLVAVKAYQSIFIDPDQQAILSYLYKEQKQ